MLLCDEYIVAIYKIKPTNLSRTAVSYLQAPRVVFYFDKGHRLCAGVGLEAGKNGGAQNMSTRVPPSTKD